MSRIKTDWSLPQRLSPVALLFIFGKTIRESWVLILYFIVRTFFKENEDADDTDKRSDKLIYFLLLSAAILLVFHIHKFIQFFKTRIYIKDNELIEQTGIFTKKTKTILIQKIQSVHLIQNYIHRFTDT
ncbi:PH domain-containing protein, partial [Sediminibacterium sp.]|uniref:PH domain-containing protein n=1 Tax=Sediminibacterium sp. TaxID=1917865 RepID=UPI003F6983F4